ncbi:hypothetical protein COCVIDRAFT_97483 [Bipolaris victoriae FI3]|uniref:Uncharacterized protein n=2 Tax=Bipolaris TaxID=33194 RepID=W6Z3M6_COCC2|nr:uncharacterized protein COCCADRAFT_83483 [Bipolaris zeicola 26-R-13]XP_014557276.1 hypothetical protein COCVIDRAFT_97483 [Bipolaris victoriae FI3]EUC38276.1 hypothetical protein COCCADRAFT_83483 [Bipolaris zeicola 26-R-13]
MQNHQTKHMPPTAGSSRLKSDAQTSSDANRTNSGNKDSGEKVAPRNNQESKETNVKEGKTAWHMERWLNETTKESTWSVHGRF